MYCSPNVVKLSNKRIRHLTDNRAVEFIFKAGSNKFRIHRLVVDIFLSCRTHGILLTVSWRSRNDPLLQIADAGSRDFDGSSFGLDFASFSVILDAFSHVNLTVDAKAVRKKRSNVWQAYDINISRAQQMMPRARPRVLSATAT